MNFGLWIEALINPQDTFSSQKNNISMLDAVTNFALASFVVVLLNSMYSVVMLTLTLGKSGIGLGALGSGLGMIALGAWFFGLIFALIYSPIMYILCSLILCGIYYVVALLLGAKGSFSSQYGLISLFMPMILILGAIFSLIPTYGWILHIGIILYGLFLLTLSLMEVHSFGTIRAALIWLIPTVIIGGIILVLFAAVFAAFSGLIAAAR